MVHARGCIWALFQPAGGPPGPHAAPSQALPYYTKAVQSGDLASKCNCMLCSALRQIFSIAKPEQLTAVSLSLNVLVWYFVCCCAQGWIATRWIPGGVGVYMGFLLMAPRLHALGKARGYVTISEFIYDRYLPPSGAPWVRRAWGGGDIGEVACVCVGGGGLHALGKAWGYMPISEITYTYICLHQEHHG